MFAKRKECKWRNHKHCLSLVVTVVLLLLLLYVKCLSVFYPPVLEFRQRQMEIETRQVTLSLKLKEDVKEEVRLSEQLPHTTQ